jgi:hypothetical protein
MTNTMTENPKKHAEEAEKSFRVKAQERILRITTKRPLTEGDFESLLAGMQNEVAEKEKAKIKAAIPPGNQFLADIINSQREQARAEILGGPVYNRPQEQATGRRFHFPRPHMPRLHLPGKK